MKENINDPTLFDEKIFFQESQLSHNTSIDVVNALADFSKNKRDSNIEKCQLRNLETIVNNKRLEFSHISLQLKETKKHGHRFYLDRKGKICERTYNMYNPVYDSKTFDAYLDIGYQDKVYTLYFVLKGAQNEGGHQGNVVEEVGIYTNLMNMNQDENTFFCFILDGTFLEKNTKYIDKSKKYFISNSETVKEKINNFIKTIING